ncbi:MAG: class I SAM-dependent methyltransferase [Xenococcaceae cyanobacterium]
MQLLEELDVRVQVSIIPRLSSLFGLGIPFPRHLVPDRRILEKKILPYFANPEQFSKILFIGCESYTEHYKEYFHKQEYWTLEIDPDKSKFGASNHVIDSITNITSHFCANYFDAIICNGLFLIDIVDDKQEIETAIDGCYKCLKPNGIFLLGWNDIEELRPYYLEEYQNLTQFTPYRFPPLNTNQYQTKTTYKHTYNFYIKN